jgi:exopolysaccharide/PEP-CTERM locus tyrosine autokinase
MKSTIEKALQRQREQEAARKLAAGEQAEENTTTSQPMTDDLGASSSEDTSLEKAVGMQQAAGNNEAADTSMEVNPDQAGSEQATSKVVSSQSLTIDVEAIEKQGFVTLSNARRQINEEYREIKRKLLSNAFGPLSKTLPNSNIIMVSSPRPSEGKTFTAVNLAMSIAAEQDKTVLLVDADVLKSNVLRTLGVDEQKGLMDYLLGNVKTLSDVIYKTNIPKLRVIPAGCEHHLSTELLASGSMNDIVNEFSTRYSDRVVIIDTPPIIGINESAILASFAGQAVMVVEEGRSKLQDIHEAVRRLNPDMAIGFVVNKSIAESESGGYYGYGSYGAERDS